MGAGDVLAVVVVGCKGTVATLGCLVEVLVIRFPTLFHGDELEVNSQVAALGGVCFPPILSPLE